MDPNNGEMLAMASAPSFDPNIFIQGSSDPEGRKQIAAYWQDEKRPLYNRAIQGRYPPGSTWKIPESVGALAAGRDHGGAFERRLRRRHHDRQQVHALHGQPRLAAAFTTPSRNRATAIITGWH